ncbi:MAG: RNA methyltransferase [bacterium]
MDTLPLARHISGDDLNLLSLQPYRVRKHTYELQRDGLFLAEGKRVVHRLLESAINVVSILTTQQVLEWLQSRIPSSRFLSLETYLTDREVMADLVGYDVQQPVLALARVPPDVAPHAVLNEHPESCLLLALDRLMNPDNIGVMIRNSVAFGVNLVIAGESSASPYYRRAVRNSMGALFQQRVYHAPSLANTLRNLKEEWNVQIIGAHPAGSVPLQNSNLRGKVCLVMGNEDTGLTPEVLELCTQTLHIPLQHSVDSLNVANAMAIFLWEIFRQRDLE